MGSEIEIKRGKGKGDVGVVSFHRGGGKGKSQKEKETSARWSKQNVENPKVRGSRGQRGEGEKAGESF